jgi:hypothetical protein
MNAARSAATVLLLVTALGAGACGDEDDGGLPETPPGKLSLSDYDKLTEPLDFIAADFDLVLENLGTKCRARDLCFDETTDSLADSLVESRATLRRYRPIARGRCRAAIVVMLAAVERRNAAARAFAKAAAKRGTPPTGRAAALLAAEKQPFVSAREAIDTRCGPFD